MSHEVLSLISQEVPVAGAIDRALQKPGGSRPGRAGDPKARGFQSTTPSACASATGGLSLSSWHKDVV